MRTLLLRYLAGQSDEVMIRSWRPRYRRREQEMFSTVVPKKYTNGTYDKRMVMPKSCGKYVAPVPFGARSEQYTDVPVYFAIWST